MLLKKTKHQNATGVQYVAQRRSFNHKPMLTNTSLEGLTYKGKGFFAFMDTSMKMSNDEVVSLVSKSVHKRVVHVAKSDRYLNNDSDSSGNGYIIHTLQYAYLFKKDQNRETRSKVEGLVNKYKK